jgi:hypothetical protein
MLDRTQALAVLLLRPVWLGTTGVREARAIGQPVGETVAKGAPPEGVRPLRIHIFGEAPEELSKDEKNRRKKALKQARSAAEDAEKTLAKRLEREHGKDRDAWPAEARERHDDAFRRVNLAALDYHLVEMKPTEVPDSVEDMRSALRYLLERNHWAGAPVSPRLVARAAEAEVSVEMLTRRSRFGPVWHLYLRVTPGGWLLDENLADVNLTRGRQVDGGLGIVWMLTRYSEEQPYWIVEVERAGAVGGGWGGAAALAVDSLVDLLGEIPARGVDDAAG